jgi:transcriptional regulator with XRE-family HTH domain
LKSTHSAAYRHLIDLLIQTRKQAGVTQQVLAARLDRPQSFVSKIELGERRLDVVEFLEVCRALGVDPHTLLDGIAERTQSQG